MICNGTCTICPNPCQRTVNYEFIESIKNTKNEIPPEIEKKASEVFDMVVVDHAGQYELTKNIFGKEKVRKVK